MRHERYDAAGRLRARWDTDARRYTDWDETGAQVVDRAFTAQENAAADEAVRDATRQTNLAVLRDRAQAAIDANLAALSTAQAIETASSFTSAQRDQAIRFLGGQAVDRIKQTNALIRLLLLAERPDLLDTTE